MTVRVHVAAILTRDGGQLPKDDVRKAAETLVEMALETGAPRENESLVLDSAAMDEVAGRLGWLEKFYQVSVSDFRSSIEEWHRAKTAPASELPPISEEEKKYLKRIGRSEEEHRRSLLAGIYGNKRQRTKARRLGELALHFLREIGEQVGERYWLVGIFWEAERLRWLLKVQTPNRVVGVPVPFELADDVVEAEILSEQDRLKQMLLAGVGKARISA